MIGLWGGIADLTAAAERATKSAHAARETHQTDSSPPQVTLRERLTNSQ